MPFRKLVLSLAALLLTSFRLALSQGTYTQIDVPGAILTGCRGIDNAGDIVGWYADAGYLYHGFLLSGGVYTTIDYPNTDGETLLTGMNDIGQFVGYVQGPNFGFLYDLGTQTFTTVSYPGVAATEPQAINDVGTIVGTVYLDSGVVEAFEVVGSTYTQITPPAAEAAEAGGITALGVIVGWGNFSGYGGSWELANGKHVRLSGLGGLVLGTNSTGTVLVGTLGTNGFSFFQKRKTLQTLQLSGAIETWASGVNRSGEVVGYFVDASNVTHGFSWTPPAPVEKK